MTPYPYQIDAVQSVLGYFSAGGEYKDTEMAIARCMGPHANDLRDFVRMVPWPTPTSLDWKDGTTTLQNTPVNALLGHQALGVNSNGSHAQMENQGRLNPAFSRWLMGFPKAWCEAAIEAWHQMPINRRKRAP